MKFLLSIFWFFIILFPALLLSQEVEIDFLHIGADKGLSQSFVTTLMKDQSGFVWAGTQDGLNQFDGYNFESFYNDPSDSNSLSNNYILDLIVSQNGMIWIGTNEKGLCNYSPHLNVFNSFQNDSEEIGANTIRCIAELDSSVLLLGTDAGLFLFDKTAKQFSKPVNKADYKKSIYSFFRIDDDTFLIGGLEELLYFNKSSKELRKITLPISIAGSIHEITNGIDNDLWFGTGNGLFNFKWNSDEKSLDLINHFLPDPASPNSIGSNYISSLFLDDFDGLWIGGNEGINYLNLKNESSDFIHYVHDSENNASLSDNLVYDFLEVEPGIIWAATQNGINQFSFLPPSIKSVSLAEQINCGQSAHGIIENNGKFLICTDKGLLTFSSLGNPQINCISKKDFPEMEDEFLISINPGIDHSFWIAIRRGGFAKYSNHNGEEKWEGFKLPAGKYSNIGTNSILELEDSSLWIGSSGLGLWHCDQKNKTYTSYSKSEADSTSISGNYIFYIYEVSDGSIWIATADGGVCKMDPSTNQFACFTHDSGNSQTLSSNMVLSVFEDSKNQIWACTANGLCLKQKDLSWKCFSKKDGLSNNVIYGMLEDEEGFLWVSTGSGLARLEVLENELVDIKVFSKSDGLINNEFNQHAFYKTATGSFIYGSRGGLNHFKTEDILDYKKEPELVFTDFKLFNESVPIKNNSADFILNKHLNFSEEIVLPYNKNFIAFEFAGINFVQGDQNQYAYQLEGLDEDWVYCGERRFASYPGLTAGAYLFKVKAANHDGIWTEQAKTIKVIVKTAPWKTWWAFALYMIVVLGIIYGLFKYRLYSIRQIERTKQEERLKFRKRSARDFHDEAGNQITRISLMTEMAKRQAGEASEMKSLLHQIGDNVQSLRTDMRDFIWVLDPDNDSLYQTLQRLNDFANSIFEYSSIQFSSSEIKEELNLIKLSGNKRRHLLMFFKEAINNCLKYSEAQNAHLKIERTDDSILLLLKDDGKGFDFENMKKGNGLKNMENRASRMNASYTFNSIPGKGTSIELVFNITQMGD